MRPETVTKIQLRAPLFSTKRFIAGVLCHPYVGNVISLMFRDRIPSHGFRIDTAHNVVEPWVKASLFWGIYESAEVRFVKRHLRPDLDVVELGGSLGVITSQISLKLKPQRRIVCVEANPFLLNTLQKNIDRNCNGRNVTIVHGAIADNGTKCEFINLAMGEDNTDSHITDYVLPNSVRVPALTLKTVLETQGIVQDFALVSDVEGAEANFIENDDGALRRCQQIIIELHETDWKGTLLTAEYLRSRLESLHGFQLVESYGPVCVFERN
jgi:FkbM family methyltransferase